MAEYTSLQAPEGSKFPPFMVIGVGVVIVGAVIYFISKQGGGGGTTAAATSINAALGSIQEENQNLLGTVQANQQQTSLAVGGLFNQSQQNTQQIVQAITDQGVSLTQLIQNQTDIINQNVNSGNQGILSGITDALAKLTAQNQALTTVVQGGFAGTNAAISSSQASVIQSVQDAQAGTLGQIIPQIQQLQQLLASGQSAQSTQVQALQSSINQSLAGEQTLFQGAIANLGNQVTGLGGQIQSVQSAIENLNSKNPVPMDFSILNNQLVYSATDNQTYQVIMGKLYNANWPFQWGPKPSIVVSSSLAQFSQGTTRYPA